jgi:ABC-type phosphate transport system auxiliary subunit
MAQPHPIDQISERVERLLLRHEELQRTNALLVDQVTHLQAERDTLKSRLQAARARIDALLDRLPSPDESEPSQVGDHKDAAS